MGVPKSIATPIQRVMLGLVPSTHVLNTAFDQ
jgi:hypothetical protein